MSVAELERGLRDLAALLRPVGESRWADWASRSADAVAAGADPATVRRAFGGMGSLNDLVIHPINGHHVEPGRVAEINERLAQLRESVYTASVPEG
ncbi:MAG: hypothetical protein PGN24_08340 [Microbacterium arborescens]